MRRRVLRDGKRGTRRGQRFQMRVPGRDGGDANERKEERGKAYDNRLTRCHPRQARLLKYCTSEVPTELSSPMVRKERCHQGVGIHMVVVADTQKKSQKKVRKNEEVS